MGSRKHMRVGISRFGAIPLVFILLALLGLPALAASGDLDSTFDGDGKVITIMPHKGWLNQLAFQTDGKILAAGFDGSGDVTDFAVNRYNVDGSLDTTFGPNGTGIVTTDFPGASSDLDFARSISLQSNGKIVLGGSGGNDFGLARYNPDGTLDTGFGSGGLVTTDFNSGLDVIRAVMLRPARILVAGYTATDGVNDWALAAYRSSGLLDASFGGGGKVVTDMGGNDQARGAVLVPGGKIVVVGYTKFGQGVQDFAVARYNSDGTLDTSFGPNGNGKVTTDLGAGDVARAVVLQSDGKIIAGGYTGSGGGLSRPDGRDVGEFAMVRYDTDGSVDTSFGVGGIVITDMGGADHARGIALQSDGKIVLAGNSRVGLDDQFAVARYYPDGSLDTTFGLDGKVITDMGTNGDGARDVKVQLDGKILLGGIVSAAGGGFEFAMARYLAT